MFYIALLLSFPFQQSQWQPYCADNTGGFSGLARDAVVIQVVSESETLSYSG